MYRKILVPLDGSELAECVLPHVETIAEACQLPDIFFIRVVQLMKVPVVDRRIFNANQLMEVDEAVKISAGEYLDGLMDSIKLGQANLKAEVITGEDIAENIIEYAAQNDVDLIIIATHGRSGVSRWVYGSVADRILRSSCIPVLMIRAPGCMPGI